MRGRFFVLLALVSLLGIPALATAQVQTGEIYGKVMDASGGILPGVMVTLSGPALLQPQVSVSSETGSYQFPRIPIGTYQLKFELQGFKTLLRQDIRVEIGFTAQVNAQLEISTVQETVTVTGESPIVDTRSTGTKSTFDLETLQSIPSARDPWVMLERTPAMTMDRVNVGGSQSGQQSGFISRGSGSGNNKWSIDGVDITDMSATGASPIYYDFDMLEEMQVTTGGADASQQTGGVGINLVTRSGTDRFKGSGRWLLTDDKFEADNVTDEIRAQGAGSGNPIQNVKDYGFEVGGPIKRGKLWYWGSYGKQDINVGVVGFFKRTDTCRPAGVRTADIPKVLDTATLRSCLETDNTKLDNYNWKLNFAATQNDRVSFQNTWAAKVRNARDAADTRPLETTFRQMAVTSDFGSYGWLTGPSPLWKAGLQHIFSDRFMADVQWAHLGNNFVLDFHEDSLRDVQPSFDIPTETFGRSFQQSVFLRPTNSLDVISNYFLPGVLGGDHQLKMGYRWRSAHSTSLNHRGGFAYARFNSGVADSAELYRDGNSVSHLETHAVYLQDTYTVKRFAFSLGLRWDRQDDSAEAAVVPQNPIAPQWLPAVSFPGADAGVIWNDISPRVGLTFDLTGDGKTQARASFSTYYGQMSPGQNSSQLAATGAVFVRFPWTDLNGDTFVQANEITMNSAADILSRSAGYDPNDPSSFLSPGRVDPDVKNDRTREVIVGFDREVMRNLGFSASYIWREYDQFIWSDRKKADGSDFSSADYREVNFTPTCSAAPADARCVPVTFYEPSLRIPSPYVRTNQPDRWRGYNGFELSLRKRYADRWTASLSYAFNDAVDHWDSPAAYEDPTNIANTNNAQYAPESGGSGIDNVFNNAKWLVKGYALYTLPWQDIGIGGNFNMRQGYPFPQSVQSRSRINAAGTVQVLLDPLGDVRLDNAYTLDFRLDKTLNFGRSGKIVPSMEVFNVTNVNTVLARKRNQAADNANLIGGIIAPRVVRFGFRVQW